MEVQRFLSNKQSKIGKHMININYRYNLSFCQITIYTVIMFIIQLNYNLQIP